MTNKSEPVVIWDAVTLTAGAADTVSSPVELNRDPWIGLRRERALVEV